MKHGDVIELGRHRLMCGDSTNPEHVARLMDGERAVLVHADPPYGMGKKGVTNDNLYREKLDAFQMAWWRACRPSLTDNGSAYIWGKAPDLWRLWYVGGLSDSERLTLRNEIVWHRHGKPGHGRKSEGLRMYAVLSERILFFMVGEQEWRGPAATTPNAEDYWEGWEPIRAYLDGERQRMGWDIATVKTLVGHKDLVRDHWFCRSQWSLPTRQVYDTLKASANGFAFLRPYDELRQDYDQLRHRYDMEVKPGFDQERWDWQATRAYFDNTHEDMVDVWSFRVVSGTERWSDHPTQKPVALLERICKSSAPLDGLILDPFAGSGSMLIAAEQTGRRCVAMELEPHYCEVIINRYREMTKQPSLLTA